MKTKVILLLLLFNTAFCYAQYDKDKLIKILTTNSWTVKGINSDQPEKSYSFSKDMSVQIGKDNGKGAVMMQKDKWTISSTDQIRWFISIGNQTYEMIISYTKSGSQYVKLTRQDKRSGLHELNLYPLK